MECENRERIKLRQNWIRLDWKVSVLEMNINQSTKQIWKF